MRLVYALVNSSSAHAPPPGQPPGISIFWKKNGQIPGVGTKKEGKCSAPEIVAFQHFCSFYIKR